MDTPEYFHLPPPTNSRGFPSNAVFGVSSAIGLPPLNDASHPCERWRNERLTKSVTRMLRRATHGHSVENAAACARRLSGRCVEASKRKSPYLLLTSAA